MLVGVGPAKFSYIRTYNHHMALTRECFRKLQKDFARKCDEIAASDKPLMYAVSHFFMLWMGERKLTQTELPNLFGVVDSSRGNRTACLAVYQNASWVPMKGDELKARLQTIRGLVAEALEKDKVHFAKLKIDAVARAEAEALAFGIDTKKKKRKRG